MWPYTLLIMLTLCGGPADPKCTEEYFESVRHYTMDHCLKIFKDFTKCDQLSRNRVKELRKKCSE